MADVATETIVKFINQLHNDPVPENKSTAQRNLIAIQNSPQAWSVVWPLLSQEQPPEVQFFGAKVLRHKVTHGWDQLPSKDRDQLRVQIFQEMLNSVHALKAIRTQLCLSLSAFVMNTTPHEWPNCINSIIQTLRNQPVSILLEILTLLPEEFESSPIAKLPQRRGAIKKELQDGVPSILALINRTLQSSEASDIKAAAIKCFISWTQFGLPIPDMMEIVRYLFQALENEDLFSLSVEALVEIAIHPDSEKYPSHMRQVIREILSLKPFIESKLDENMEVGKQVCKVVVEFATANRLLLLNVQSPDYEVDGIQLEEEDDKREEALSILHLILDLTQLPGSYMVNEMASEETLRFWSDILESIAAVDSDEDRKSLEELYQPIFIGLVEAFTNKAMYPSDEAWQDLDGDDQGNFHVYREDLNDVATLLQSFVHLEYMEHMARTLRTCLSSPSPLWQQAEAILFLLQAASQTFNSSSFSYLDDIFSQLTHLPSHLTLSRSLITLLGSLGSWLSQQSSLLPQVMQTLFKGLHNRDMAPTAAIAFRDVCDECAPKLVPFITELLPACQAALNMLDTREAYRVVVALSRVLSQLNSSDLRQALQQMNVSQLAKLKELTTLECTPGTAIFVDREIQVVGGLCGYIDISLTEGEQHPLLNFVMGVWPHLKVLLAKWSKDENIVHAICVCLQRIIRTLGMQYAVLLRDTSEVLPQYLDAMRHPRIIDVTSQIVSIFATSSQHCEAVQVMVHRMYDLCMKLYEDGTFKEQPELLKSYLLFLSCIITKNAQHIITKENAPRNMFELGVEALQASEQHTVLSAGTLLCAYLSQIGQYQVISDIVTNHGKRLVARIIQGISGTVPRSHMTSHIDILQCLSKHHTELLSVWMNELLSQEGFPTERVSHLEKKQFMTAVLRDAHNKRMFNSRVNEFSLCCRGFHGIIGNA